MADVAVRNVEYLLWLPTRQILLVTAGPVGDDYYASFRAYMGWLGGDLGSVEVTGVNRLKDGGTTWVITSEGELYVPSQSRRFEWPTWSDGPVWKLDLAVYDIDLREDSSPRVTGPAKDEALWRRTR